MSLERLAFSFNVAVPSRRVGPAPETFATAAFSEPRDWGYSGLLCFTVILLFRPQDDIRALEMLRPAEVAAVLAVAPMILHRLARRMPVFKVTRETLALFAMAGVMLATAPFSIWPGGAIMEFIDTFSKVVIIFVLMMNTVTTPRRIQQICTLMFLAAGYIAARGVFNYFRGVNLIEDGRLAGPVGGIFGNPNDLALNMVALLPLAILAALGQRYSKPWRLVAAAAALLMVATIVFTKSRGGLIGLAIMLVTFVVLSFRIRPLLAVALVLGIIGMAPFLPESFAARMATIFNPEKDAISYTGSYEGRTRVMKEGLAVFQERPLTGVGAGQFVNYNYEGRVERSREAHNSVIQVAADLGILGLLAFTFLVYSGVRTSLWLRRSLGPQPRRRPSPAVGVLTADDRSFLHDHAVAMTASMLGWFACAMFASVAYSWTFYYLLALTIASRELILDRVAGRASGETGHAASPARHSLRTHAEPVRA